MRVQCSANTAAALSTRHFRLGYTDQSVFDLEKGGEYRVFGISVYRDVIHYLVVDRTERPNWYPAEMFRVTDVTLPVGWGVVSRPENVDGLQLLVGYGALVEDPTHYDALIERDPAAMMIFSREVRTNSSSDGGEA